MAFEIVRRLLIPILKGSLWSTIIPIYSKINPKESLYTMRRENRG
jgi:hypothetical protein